MIDLNKFMDELASDSPAPGGGAGSAISGIVGESLASMVASLSMKKKGNEQNRKELERMVEELKEIREELEKAAEMDTQAFNRIMEARKLPKSTDSEKKIREEKIEGAMKGAVSTPWKIASLLMKIEEKAVRLMKIGIPGAITDAGAALKISFSSAESALLNVSINLKYIKDREYVENEKIKLKIFAEDLRNIKKQGEEILIREIGREFMW